MIRPFISSSGWMQGLSEQRKKHIEAEFEMYLRKEQLRMDFVTEAQAMHKLEVLPRP